MKKVLWMPDFEIVARPEIKKYFENLQIQVSEQYNLAKKVKEKGFDVSTKVEMTPAVDLADRAETLIGLPGLARRYREVMLEKNDRMGTYFQLFKEIIEQKWCSIPEEQKRLEIGIKACLLIQTEGVVVAPLDGLPKIEINKNPDGSKYVDIYFAGPIRAAGGSSTVIPLILGDYGRQLLKLEKYKPTKDEIERYVEEVGIYQTEIVSRQYVIPEKEIRIIVENCPVCVNGTPTEKVEVSVHRDLPRIPTNRIRGGVGLVISEGLALKAMWVMDKAKKYAGLDWSFLEKIIKVEKKQSNIEIKPNYKILDGLAAGRPILAYPSRWGGFRLRYGRGRNTGIMAKAINPASMITFDEFIAVGTHGKIERPGKATQFFPCSTIDGPIVLLKDGAVLRVNSLKKANEIKVNIKKILYIGDLLVSYGDFRKSAHPLMPTGYVEEWWVLELQKKLKDFKKRKEYEKEIGLEKIVKNPNEVEEALALEISKNLKIPLHPKYLHYYKALNKKELSILHNFLLFGVIEKENNVIKKIILENNIELKKLLEKIGLPHKIFEEKIVIEEFAISISKTFSLEEKKSSSKEDVLEYLSEISNLIILDKAGTFIGARMGRPEQAKRRQMKGNPHVLFPIGLTGGSIKSINKAIATSVDGKGLIKSELAQYFDPIQKQKTFLPYNKENNSRNVLLKYCRTCKESFAGERCTKCGAELKDYGEHEVNIKDLLDNAKSNLRLPIPDLIKGVVGMISDAKEVEPLEKGILRARHKINIFRDGTSRFELLNATITHIKPKEINLTVKKMIELGYEKDYLGNSLIDEDQLVELFPQDIIVNSTCGDWLLDVSRFVDDELQYFYKEKPFYNAKTKEDLIGQLVLGLAPHTSAGVTARILGYTQARLGFGHPYFVCAKRRNCLVYETPILIENNGKIDFVEIGSLSAGKKLEKIKNLNTFTIDSNGKTNIRKIKSITARKSPKKIIFIKTKYGRELKLTKDHELMVLKNDKLVHEKISDLTVGDKLLSLKQRISFQKNNELNLLNYYLKKEDKENLRISIGKNKLIVQKNILKIGYNNFAKKINYKTGKSIHTAISFDALPLELYEKISLFFGKHFVEKIYYKKQKSRIPTKILLDKEFGEIIGLFLSDGYARTTNNSKNKKYVYQINFVSTEKEITNKIKNFFKKLGKEIVIEKRKTKNISLDYIIVSGRVYYDLFVNILKTGEKAKTKKISSQLINSNIDFIKGIISGYVVGGGSVSQNSIRISSVNKKMLNGVSFLLTQVNCFPHLLEQKRVLNKGELMNYYKKPLKYISQEIRLYSTDILTIGENLFGEKKKTFNNLNKKIFRHKRNHLFGDFVIDELKEIKEINGYGKVFDLIVEKEKNFIGGHGNLAIYDCDGDQDSVMLLMDGLLNFSQKFLANRNGGKMDAAIVFSTIISPNEIDDEVFEMETCSAYPLEFYETTRKVVEPFLDFVPLVKNKLATIEQYSGIGFTHNTNVFDEGPKTSQYIQLKTMEEKINKQNDLQKKIIAVDAKDSLERVMGSHFLPDIIGNARAFSRQSFRCTSCNEKYRRLPLSGRCYKCGKDTIILTIHQGSVRKYLKIAQNLAQQEQLSDYLIQRLKMIEKEIDSVFKDDNSKQKGLFDFV
jgi:DNA polymerase II large subunit